MRVHGGDHAPADDPRGHCCHCCHRSDLSLSMRLTKAKPSSERLSMDGATGRQSETARAISLTVGRNDSTTIWPEYPMSDSDSKKAPQGTCPLPGVPLSFSDTWTWKMRSAARLMAASI